MKTFSLFIFLLSLSFPVLGQGCSDSGFCSMGAIRPNQSFFKNIGFKLRSLELNYHYGRTKFGDNIWVTTLEGNFNLGRKTSLQFRLPYVQIQGDMGSLHGIGDLSLSLSQTIYASEQHRVALLVGARLPANNGNRKSPDHNIPLPSYYQTSLGTFDGVLGISWLNKDWLIATGLQKPLGSNQNDFLWGVWNQTEIAEIARRYPHARAIQRGADWMLRVERKLRLGPWTAHLGWVGIYRLQEDVVSMPENNQRMNIMGTNGLASNATFGLGYSFNVHSHLKFLLGKKINERPQTIDGLQREFIAQMSYEWRF